MQTHEFLSPGFKFQHEKKIPCHLSHPLISITGQQFSKSQKTGQKNIMPKTSNLTQVWSNTKSNIFGEINVTSSMLDNNNWLRILQSALHILALLD